MLRILVIDDYVTITDNLGHVLTEAGWTPINCRSAEDAIAWLHHSPKPKVILADQFLPVMTGLELLRYIRSDPSLSDIPFILMTAADDQAYDSMLFEFYDVLKGNLIIRKPFTNELLLKSVSEIADVGSCHPL